MLAAHQRHCSLPPFFLRAAARVVAVHDDVKALLAGFGAVQAAEMPFAKDAGGLTGRLQCIRHAHIRDRQTALVRDRHEAHPTGTADSVG